MRVRATQPIKTTSSYQVQFFDLHKIELDSRAFIVLISADSLVTILTALFLKRTHGESQPVFPVILVHVDSNHIVLISIGEKYSKSRSNSQYHLGRQQNRTGYLYFFLVSLVHISYLDSRAVIYTVRIFRFNCVNTISYS